MCNNNNPNKIIITMQEVMEQMGISDKTLHRMIQEGELPEFTYGTSQWSRKKGWHTAVLERHAMKKYEDSRRIQDARHASEVLRKDVAVDILGNADAGMPKQQRNLNNRDTTNQQGSSKVMSKRMRSTSCQSRVAAGFSDVSV